MMESERHLVYSQNTASRTASTQPSRTVYVSLAPYGPTPAIKKNYNWPPANLRKNPLVIQPRREGDVGNGFNVGPYQDAERESAVLPLCPDGSRISLCTNQWLLEIYSATHQLRAEKKTMCVCVRAVYKREGATFDRKMIESGGDTQAYAREGERESPGIESVRSENQVQCGGNNKY